MPLRPRKSSLFIVVFLFVLISLGWGTASGVEDLVYKGARPLKKIFETQKKSVSEVATEAGEKTYYYDPTGKTDPFKSFIAEQESIEANKARKPKTYLETLDLSQLELIAIIVGPKGNWAMVRDSKGLGHVIQKGTAMGTRGGVVYKIAEGEVTIREEFKDFRGQKKFKDVAKKVPSLR